MQLSTTTKYAIRILGMMAKNSADKFTAKQLSADLDIPYKYLTKIVTKLTKSDILSTTRGKYGGVYISKDIKDIKIIDIVIVFDDINDKRCVIADIKCDFEKKCIVHEKWEKPRCAIDNFFTKTTLLELIDDPKLIETDS
ncbi:MAG: hypothetical protein B1H07_00865 [Campylobacteraceae bacterium 4484_166]|nr:MAG: hypothetical protein B1H07_00865 [Campylobacteraceae bacterium 4484_166]